MSSRFPFMWLFVCCFVLVSFSSSGASSPPPVSRLPVYTTYGAIDPTHVQALPNYVNGELQHYVLNNLVVHGVETLSDITVLYSVNPDVSGLPYVISLHVARPATPSDSQASSRQIKYVETIELTGVVSGQKFILSAEQQLQLQAGDLLSIHVPNNAIFLRVGPNNQGLNLPYAVLSVAPNTADQDRTGTFQVVTAGSTSSTKLQLCTQYGTVNGGNIGSMGAPAFAFQDDWIITADGDVTSFRVETVSGVSDIVIAVAKSDGSGGWYLDHTRQLAFQNIANLQLVTIPQGALHVIAGERIGVSGNDLRSFYGGTKPWWWIYPIDGDGGTPVTVDTPLAFYGAGFDWQFTFHVTASGRGDPQFAGFQGQNFQFHGLADEVFNLISSPQLQVNSHFSYLSSGKCDYNNTLCFQHPGTYLDVLGFTIPSQQGSEVHIKIVAGAHHHGLRMWMGPIESHLTEITLGTYSKGLTWQMDAQGSKATVIYNTFGQVSIRTPMFEITVVNSDFFFNVEFGLLDYEMLRIGSVKHTITDRETCKADKHGHAYVDEDAEEAQAHARSGHRGVDHTQHGHGVVEAVLANKYHVTFPVHGLVGQTWRNVKVCGKDWMGGVQDYVTSSLFGQDYFYHFYRTNTNTTHTQ